MPYKILKVNNMFRVKNMKSGRMMKPMYEKRSEAKKKVDMLEKRDKMRGKSRYSK